MDILTPLINGRAYAWENVLVNIGGRVVKGIQAIEYDDEQEIEDNPGVGNQPVSRGFGQINYSGSLTLHMEEVEALQAASPTGRLQDLPFFNITVAFSNGAKTTTHLLEAVTMKNNGRKMQVNDKRVDVVIPLAIGRIKFN